MGILQRLALLIRSNINDAISRGENPDKVLTQLIADMREQLARAKQEVAGAIADERKLRAQVEDEHRKSREWEERAMLAVREDRDDLAKQALVRQEEHAERAASLEDTWRRQAAETEQIKASLTQLNERIEEAKRKRSLLMAKQKRVRAQQRIHQTMAGLSDKSAFEAFERMAERIEEEERRSLAAVEVAASLSGEPLEEEFTRLEGADAVEQRLLALKQRMGLAPAESGGDLPAGEKDPSVRRLKAARVEEEQGESGTRSRDADTA